MPTMVPTYKCDICGRTFPSKAAAVACEAYGRPKPSLQVGDIVFARSGFGWYDGDRAWVSNPTVQGNPKHGNCFAACCTYRFYYVVTAIDTDTQPGSHRIRYHLVTNAMDGRSGYRSGYTFDSGHHSPTRVPQPPRQIVKESKALIGLKASHLL